MKKDQNHPTGNPTLRCRAEERLERQMPAGGWRLTVEETARLVHELQVHQIELEMQNEELQQTRAQLEALRAEERLQARARVDSLLAQYTDLYDSAPVGYFCLDREGAIRQMNLAAARLLGIERSSLMKRRFGLFVAEHDRPAFSDFLERVSASRARECCEVTLPQEGSQPLLVRIEGTRSSDGQECRAVMLDITEQRRLEAQLQHAQKMETVGRLAGGIAHDFNNLLTIINGTADLALTELKEDEPLRAEIQDIRMAGERAASLTRQLLAFSRKQIMKLEVLDLSALIAELQGMLRRLIGEDITLVVGAAKDAGRVMADRLQIEQVVMNLAVNARDAMPEGGTLSLEIRNVQLDEAFAAEHPFVQPGPHVMLAIRDSGVGMDQTTRERIFEPFFTTKDPGKGTGLGLSTAYGIIKQSGGSIWVYGEPGRGTTFKIYLPRVEDVADRTPQTPTVPSVQGSETILVVEDEVGVRNLARRILQSAGYTVLTASDGAEALLVLERHEGRVHLVFSDMVMPGMTGPDLVARLRGISPPIRIILTSGFADRAIQHSGLIDRAAYFIDKPYTAAELKRRVREALDS